MHRLASDIPSATAFRVAMRRAAHQFLDDPPIFVDPLASRIVGLPADSAAARAVVAQSEGSPIAPFFRAFFAARSRLAEDCLADAIARGVGQFIILGAGLDTFPYRNPLAPEALRIFEVDHPATQSWKRSLLAGAGIPIPPALTYAPIDFEKQTLRQGLADAGFDFSRPAYFSWLGVVPYLTQVAIAATLAVIASLPSPTAVIFDYSIPPESMPPAQRRVFDQLAQRVARIDEPWISFFDPPALAGQLRTAGFSSTFDFGPDEINARFFAHRADRLRVGGAGRIMLAST